MAVNGPAFPVPVFAAVGAGAWGPVQELRARREVRLVASPRHASVLLIAGSVPREHAEALDRVHDQVPHPRRTVAWVGEGTDHPVASVTATGSDSHVVAAIVDAHRSVWRDRSVSEPDRLADLEPNEWRGVGPYGQGGEGMMGGTPYGRPMAMTGHDRDGLTLDQLDLLLGPFLDALPPGLVLDVTMQGEVLQRVEVRYPRGEAPVIGSPLPEEAGSDDEAELRRGLRWLAHGLHVHGLDALAARAAWLAIASDRHARRNGFSALRRAVRRAGLLWGLRGVGRIDGQDAAGRWLERLDGIEAGLAGEPARAARAAVPSGRHRNLGELEGMTLTDAVTTIVSLDIAGEATDELVGR